MSINRAINKPLVFCGVSANILIYVEAAEKNGISVAGIVDSDYYGRVDQIQGIPIIGLEQEFLTRDRQNYSFFIGTNWTPHSNHARDVQKRLNFINLLNKQQIRAINLIDPTAVVSNRANLGQGIFIGAGAIIEPTCNIADFVQIFYNASINYGSSIMTNSTVQNNALIAAHIGENTFVGMNAKIFPYYNPGHIKIGNNASIYPNLSVHYDVENNSNVTADIK